MTDPPGLYVYAVLAAPAPSLGSGIDGSALTTVTVDGLAAVVHEHHGPPYQGDDAIVRRRVLEHNEVVDGLWNRERALLPMTFDVIVAGTPEQSATDRLERWLRTSADALRGGLRQVTGRVELHVDLALDVRLAAAADPEVRRLRERIATEQPGVARLLRKRLDGLERDAAERTADGHYPEARARLARCSTDLVENSRAAAETGEVLVLSAALLVDEEATGRVGAELAALAEEWPALRVRFLGPWPPYSFAALRPDGLPAGAGPSR